MSYVVAIQMLSADGSRLHFVWTLLSRQASSVAALGVQTKWKASGWPGLVGLLPRGSKIFLKKNLLTPRSSPTKPVAMLPTNLSCRALGLSPLHWVGKHGSIAFQTAPHTRAASKGGCADIEPWVYVACAALLRGAV